MVRKPMIPMVASLAESVDRGLADKGLAVKDGLREVRFNVRHGARKLMEAVEAATHPGPVSINPLGPLGRPLNLAVRKAADLLGNVDDAAVHLLASDGDYRSMAVPLPRSELYFCATAAGDLRQFTTDHHWRYRHWLGSGGHDDIFVHEQAIAIAGAQVARTCLAGSPVPADDGAIFGDCRRHVAATLVEALSRQEVLSKAALLPGEAARADELSDLMARGAVVVVLAGEIASQMAPAADRDKYAGALQLADEITTADRDGWLAALHAPDAVEALGRWFGFVMLHL